MSHHISVRKPLIKRAALPCSARCVCVLCMCVCVYEREVGANISLFLPVDWCGNWQGKSCIPYSKSSSFYSLSLRCRGGAESRVILQQACMENMQCSFDALCHINRYRAFYFVKLLERHMRKLVHDEILSLHANEFRFLL